MNFNNYVPEQCHPEARLQPEEELQLTKLLMDRATDAIFAVDADARFLYVNEAACCMVGYSCIELLSMTMYEIDPEFSLKVWSETWKTIKQQGSICFESQHRTYGKPSYPVEIAITYLEYYGREYGCIFVRDITERRQAQVALKKVNEALECRVQERTVELKEANDQLYREIAERKQAEARLEKSLEALQQSETKFRTLAETTHAIIVIIRGTQLGYVNLAAEALTGYKQEELIAHPDFNQLLKIEDCQWAGIEEGGTTLLPHQEIKLATKSGEERWLDCSVGLFEFEGKPAKLVTAVDITERKQAEVEVRQALEQEKELGEVRARLISMVSHEFRTPLNLILFSATLLRRQSHQWSEEKKRQYLERIQTAVEQLTQLMDEVLIIGRAEAGKLTFEPRVLDLNQFCYDLVAEVQLSDNNQHIITFMSQGDRSTAWVDEKLLQPILTNLLSNAVKYSAADSTVNLTLFYKDREVIFQVKDEGIGIPLADRQQLFEPFNRGSNVSDIPGTGLGLAVVKKLLHIYKGQITVESEVGVGTIFTVKLPSVPPVQLGVPTSLIFSTDRQLDS